MLKLPELEYLTRITIGVTRQHKRELIYQVLYT